MANDAERQLQLEGYRAALALLQNEVNPNWTRLSNSVLVSSILVAAWGVVFVGLDKPPRLLLLGICAAGVLNSVAWFLRAVTTNGYQGYWMMWLELLEAQLRLPAIWANWRVFHREGAVQLGVEEQPVCLSHHRPWRDVGLDYDKHIVRMPHAGVLRAGRYLWLLPCVFLVAFALLGVYSFFLSDAPWFWPDRTQHK